MNLNPTIRLTYIRHWMCVLAAAVIAAMAVRVPAVDILGYFRVRQPPLPDQLSRLEHQLAALRQNLPEHGAIGYVGRHPAIGGYGRPFTQLQYVLAPLVVEEHTDHLFVVGLFTDPSDLEAMIHNGEFELIATYDPSWSLLKRRQP